MRRLAATLLLSAATLACAAPAALALPGDAPIVPSGPADGATVPANAAGIAVAYQCPAYRNDRGGPFALGDAGDYEVRFSDTPATEPGGRLAGQPYGSDASATVGADGATCTSLLDTYDNASSPEIVGGRVYWQAYRECVGCPDGSGYEAGPVRSFVVAPDIRATLSAPRVYAGYLAVFTVRSAQPLGGAQVILEQRRGGSWRALTQRRFGETTELIAKLPRGKQTIRAVIAAGAQRIVAGTRMLTVRRDRGRTTSGRDDGRYAARDAPKNSTLRFKVSGDGRTLRDFRASLTAFCIGSTIEDNRFIIAFAALRSARIAPDGSVTGLLQLEGEDGTRVVLTGRLRRGRFRGEVDIGFSTCSGSRKLEAVLQR